MKKEWFEPGADGESPFVRKYNASPGTAGESVAAAFRALLAGEQSVDTQRSIAAVLANGQLSLQDEITGMRAEVGRLTVELRACKDERMAAEIERDAADEFVKRLTAERDALQASLRDEQAKRASIEAELAACRESRDALRARIDAGDEILARKNNAEIGRWCWLTDGQPTHRVRIIDARPIAETRHERD